MSLQSHASHHRSALLQDVHGRDEHVLVGTLEQEAQQGDASGVADGLLVLGAFAAAPQRQQSTPGHLDVLPFLCGQVGQVGDFLQHLDLSKRDTQVSRLMPKAVRCNCDPILQIDFIFKMPAGDLRILRRT